MIACALENESAMKELAKRDKSGLHQTDDLGMTPVLYAIVFCSHSHRLRRLLAASGIKLDSSVCDVLSSENRQVKDPEGIDKPAKLAVPVERRDRTLF